MEPAVSRRPCNCLLPSHHAPGPRSGPTPWLRFQIPGALKAFRNGPVPGRATSQDPRPPTCGRLLPDGALLSSAFLVGLSVVSSFHPTVPHRVLTEPLGAPVAAGQAAPAQARC